jgi:hypothetical protein
MTRHPTRTLSVFGSWATGAGKDELFDLGYASRDARADGAEGDIAKTQRFCANIQ